MQRAAAIAMVRNEEVWIEAILQPFIREGLLVIVGDTGSTDETWDILGRLPVMRVQFGQLVPRMLGQVRCTLGGMAAEQGADWVVMADGDELYNRATVRSILGYEMPVGKTGGFVTMRSLDVDPDGSLWEIADTFNRLAILPAICNWHGDYPFEAPEVFDNPALFTYLPVLACGPPAGGPGSPPAPYEYHALHLHRLARSRQDEAVFMRKQKQFQYSLQDVKLPRLGRFDMAAWLAGGS